MLLLMEESTLLSLIIISSPPPTSPTRGPLEEKASSICAQMTSSQPSPVSQAQPPYRETSRETMTTPELSWSSLKSLIRVQKQKFTEDLRSI